MKERIIKIIIKNPNWNIVFSNILGFPVYRADIKIGNKIYAGMGSDPRFAIKELMENLIREKIKIKGGGRIKWK